MVSFRRLVLAIAVLALFTGLASAQIVVGGPGSTGGSLVCTANVAAPTQVRAEGHTELLGDIQIACTGGAFLAPGTAVPTVNITVALAQTYITSRVFSTSTGLSEALLLIDEPNGIAPGTAGFPLSQCTVPGSTTPSLVGAGVGGCATVAGMATPSAPLGPAAYAAVRASDGTTVPNVFEGIVPQIPGGSNQVVFNGIPLLAPVTAGTARVFRITNLRAAASLLPSGGAFQGTTPVYASVSVSGSGLLLQQSNLVTANVFTGLNPNTTLVRNNVGNAGGSSIITGGNVGPLLQCSSLSTPSAAAVLRFGEGFASAFKTRVTPTNTLTGAGTPANSLLPVTGTGYAQNVPGVSNQGSESGFILPLSNGNIAGLADFGTRLKATFSNVPAGVTIYVTTTNVNTNGTSLNSNLTNSSFQANQAAINAGLGTMQPGTSTNLIAGLVIGETAGAQGAVGGQTGALPLLPATTNQGGWILTALTPDANGTATAVWEILAANPAAQEAVEFGVFYSFTGNQVAGTPPVTPAATVSMSFAPTTTTFNGGSSIPRFVGSQTSTTLINVALCQTTLLFPFVNSAPGFDTGISIANTSADVSPFSTKNQTGACTLNFFGTGLGTKTAFAFPSAGGNIAPGTLNAEQTSNIASGFTGYVIAVCNFQLAHGYALFSDTGIRNWATGYLALVIANNPRSAPESLGH